MRINPVRLLAESNKRDAPWPRSCRDALPMRLQRPADRRRVAHSSASRAPAINAPIEHDIFKA